MKRNLIEIYALAVCFVTVVCFVISLGVALYSAIGIANPEFTLSAWEFERHQSNDAFWQQPQMSPFPGAEKEKIVRPAEPELTKQRLDSYARALKIERRNSAQAITKSLIIILINMALFWTHWLIGRRARQASAV